MRLWNNSAYRLTRPHFAAAVRFVKFRVTNKKLLSSEWQNKASLRPPSRSPLHRPPKRHSVLDTESPTSIKDFKLFRLFAIRPIMRLWIKFRVTNKIRASYRTWSGIPYESSIIVTPAFEPESPSLGWDFFSFPWLGKVGMGSAPQGLSRYSKLVPFKMSKERNIIIIIPNLEK